jgi:hypothetical protein
MTQRLEKQTDDLVADESASSEPTIEPTQAEIDEWARRERERRQEWLQGPTVEEREAYASRLRQRRLSETFEEGEARVPEGRSPSWSRPAANGRRRRRSRPVDGGYRSTTNPRDRGGSAPPKSIALSGPPAA